MGKQAFLVVDVQTGFIDGMFSVYQAESMLERIKQLIEKARSTETPLIYVQHNEDIENDGPIHPSISPTETDNVILKMTPDSFHETNLEEVLRKLCVEEVVIAGFQTDYCINATAKRANELGYHVTIVEDAHSTIDSDDQTASEIIKEYNSRFKQIANLSSTQSVIGKNT